MLTTNTLLDALKDKYSLDTDYQAHKLLCVTPQAVYNFRSKKRFFDEKTCLVVAELLELDPLQVIACVNFERAHRQHDEKLEKFWLTYCNIGDNLTRLAAH